MRIEYHRTLIADKIRNDAFYTALKKVIVPGKTVVADIGCGTGLLGLMAAKLGARDVFLFETAEIAGVAAKLLKANRARNCHLIPCHSTEFTDRLAVDVIVSETLGNYALEENIVSTLNDARKRFLNKGGVVIPANITQYACPVIAPRFENELRAWREVDHAIDFAAAEVMSRNNVYVRTIGRAELLDNGKTAAVWDNIDLTRDTKSTRKGEASWCSKSTETIYGFAVWWTADLGSGIALSTGPAAPRTHWEQLYFPLQQPIPVMAGETISVMLRSTSSEAAGTHLAWTATLADAKGKVVARQALDLDKGFLP